MIKVAVPPACLSLAQNFSQPLELPAGIRIRFTTGLVLLAAQRLLFKMTNSWFGTVGWGTA